MMRSLCAVGEVVEEGVVGVRLVEGCLEFWCWTKLDFLARDDVAMPLSMDVIPLLM
jgi:hypothetical protein